MADVTPFELIDRGVDQTQPGALAQVPSYGISGTDTWSNLRPTGDSYVIEPAPGQAALQRLACKDGQVWKLVQSQPSARGLKVSKAAGERIATQRLDCVTENATRSVVYVSLPWAKSDLVGPIAALTVALPLLSWCVSGWL